MADLTVLGITRESSIILLSRINHSIYSLTTSSNLEKTWKLFSGNDNNFSTTKDARAFGSSVSYVTGKTHSAFRGVPLPPRCRFYAHGYHGLVQAQFYRDVDVHSTS